MWKIFLVFLRLGCTSFGGPAAHIGYFREEFVARRRWLEEAAFAEIVAFCQMLPGPASSQTGFTIGLVRGGWRGSLAAWVGFTLPSALTMTAFAYAQGALRGSAAAGAIHGLQLVAVAVVAQAVAGMRQSLAPDRARVTIAVIATTLTLLLPWSASQLVAIVFGGVTGLVLLRDADLSRTSAPLVAGISRVAGAVALTAFTALLAASPFAFFNAFYRSGALVFGGGHVVLPLLQSATVGNGWVDERTFLAGYGAAQAMPGPLFTFAAFLGAASSTKPAGIPGAAVALFAIFLPGLLLVIAVLPFWNALRSRPWVSGVLNGVNAAVVGILAAALYRPVWVSAVRNAADFCVALGAFALLTAWKLPPWMVVASAAIAGGIMGR